MKTLAKLDVGDGREATIFECEDGSTYWSPGIDVWLTADPEPVVAPVPAGTLVAGEMPPGSVSVEVRGAGTPLETVVAGGRFLALVAGEYEHGEVFSLFRNERGGIGAPALGEELKREALDAEDIVCPACGGRDWDRVKWRADKEVGRTRKRAVLCHTCGYAPMGVEILEPRRGADEPPVEDPRPLSPEPTAAEIVDVAPFPVYMLDEPELSGPRFAGASWTESGLLSVRLAARRDEMSVEVASSVDDGGLRPARELARVTLVSYIFRDRRAERDPDREVTALRRAITWRGLMATLGRAPARSVSLRVGDLALDAQLVEHEGAWAASTGTVTVRGRNVAPGEVALRLLRSDDEFASACVP
jgi:hypothetical protein